MDKREKYLLELKLYTEGIDNELSMILQSLQWDRNDLLQGTTKVTCKYDTGHRIPSDKREEHEKTCCFKQQGYSNDTMLPDPLDINSNTLVKLNNEDISQIIETASKSDPSFKKGIGSRGPEPSSLARVQAAYTADERRAIYDAVVSAVPACHDLTDLALLSSNGAEQKGGKSKSRVEILAELRDMRRRRTKYRVAAKTRNYSDVLRDILKTQMEFYSDVHVDASIATIDENRETNKQIDNSKDNEHINTKQISKTDHHRHEKYSQDTFRDRGFGWSSEHINEGNSDRDRYVKRSRDTTYGHREESLNSKPERRDDNIRGSSKYKHDRGGNRNDKDRSRNKSYDGRAEPIKGEHMKRYSSGSKNKDEGRSHRTDRVRDKSKERKYVKGDSITREDGNKYDKYKSRDSKRRYEGRSTSFYRGNESDQSEREEKYRRYYDV